MNEDPKVTVIITSYNHRQYIGKAIDSILNQSYNNIQLIVVDDGSTDGSQAFIKELATKFGFDYLLKVNEGVSAALNDGIKLAEGEYLCTCASDDYYHLDKIRKQVDYLENNPFYGLCYSNRYKFYENGIVRKLPVNDIQEGYLFSELLTQKIRVNPCTIMYRMEVIHDIGLYDVTLAVEDFDYILRVAYKYKIGFLDDYLFYYRSHANNTVNLTDKMQINSNLILGKWVHTSSYQEAVFLNDLQYFRAFASLQKTKAIKLMPLYKGVIYRREFYEGLLRLLIPKFIYKAIMRR